MKLKKIYILFCSGLFALNINGQGSTEKRAGEKYNDYAFSDAISSYESLVKKGYSSKEIYKNLGNAYYFNARYEAASEWYGKLFELKDISVDPEYIYRYAQTLKSLKKYDESDKWMQRFKKEKSTDNRSEKFINTTDYLKKIESNSGRYTINNSPVNSSSSDFSPSFYEDKLVFSTARDTGFASRNIHQWNKSPFLNLYVAEINEDSLFQEPRKLSKSLNQKTHESSTAFTKDGNTLYFTRNNSVNGNFSRDSNGISRLKIYKATKDDNEWINIIELPFNGDDYSVAHPTLSPNEDILYFASDMEGTLGASDIFMVAIHTDGTFGTPINLGPKINTESRETFPFMTGSGLLYFASDGHPGLGGLDIFAVQLGNKSQAIVQNVGKPINSEKDDFSFIINENTSKGYFASNREEGKGSDDIYSFLETKTLDFTCNTIISGIVKDEKTQEIIPRSNLAFLDNNGDLVTKTVSDSDGSFKFSLPCEDGSFQILASKTDYSDGSATVIIKEAKNVADITLTLESTITEEKVGTDLAKSLGLEPIYFDLDKSFIRADAKYAMEKVVAYMKQYPNSKIEIKSHTDAKANDNYNKRLSERRAKATVKYLISQGIAKNRLTGKGLWGNPTCKQM